MTLQDITKFDRDYPHNLVKDANYFRDVLGHLSKAGPDAFVRFGLQGKGVCPNYQIDNQRSGYRMPFIGMNHRPDDAMRKTGYEDNHLTADHYSFTDIQHYIAKFARKRSG